MSTQLGAHVPWAQVDNFLGLVLGLGLTPEIAVKGPDLDSLDHAFLDRVARTLLAAKVRPTVHAPFFDLNPGALDPLIRDVTLKRFRQALSVADCLNAHLMVIHPGVDKWRYPNLDQTWMSLAKGFFLPFVELAEKCNCRLAIENIYEETPQTLVQLANEIDSEWFGHCFDAGHWQLFGRLNMAEWLDAIGPRLFHLHLHDNHGSADEHLPVGDGIIDFTPLWHKLSQMHTHPSVTLEAHTPEHLQRSLLQVKGLFR